MDDYAPSRYKLIKRIGEGVHGVVIRAIDLTTNKDVAIKKIALRTRHGDLSINAIREIKVLQYCDHRNILSLLDIFPDASGMGLVFEYMPCTLHTKIKDPVHRLSRSSIRSYMKMLLEGLSYMHSLGILHRDIKPANLLINCNNQLKIADFGLSRVFDETNADKCYSPQVASRWYRAPELLWGSSKYGPGIDTWAAGCVFAEMLRSIPLFKGRTDIEQLAIVIQTLGSPTIHSWPEVTTLPDYNKISFPPTKRKKWESLFPTCTKKDEIGLVDSLIRYDPKKRLSAKEALSHIYFI
ncbi:cyclin-dependent kinase 20-like [Bradysia coprophila]|uniref:cyclin-dependent kinase 20-like n=1 Tax=Bradysia coprophila TaxID=38358 RepID=UPI00187D73F2|nr:cyclin-dependent kinase 20-like [Bradysia coprophila]